MVLLTLVKVKGFVDFEFVSATDQRFISDRLGSPLVSGVWKKLEFIEVFYANIYDW